MDEILKNTKSFGRNPLGIIALFISLVYGFACIVLSTSSSNLETQERAPLIWFLVIFPLVIMVSFLYLVTKHHRKLYGPGDFKNERIFLETIDIKSQKKILNESSDSKAKVLQDNSNVSYQKTERLKNYLISENLVLRILEKKYNAPVRRNVRFKGYDSSFDGIIEFNERIIGIEIKYFDKVDKDYIEPIAYHYRRRIHAFQRIVKQFYPTSDSMLEFIIVHNENVQDFKSTIKAFLSKESGLNIQFIDYSELKRQFGILENHNQD